MTSTNARQSLTTMKGENMSNHSTADEISFIKNLGKHTLLNENYQGRRDKQELLTGYLDGCEKRERWGDIDKDEVMKFALRELTKAL